MPCCEISDRAQMSKTIIAVRHFALGGRESLETAVKPINHNIVNRAKKLLIQKVCMLNGCCIHFVHCLKIFTTQCISKYKYMVRGVNTFVNVNIQLIASTSLQSTLTPSAANSQLRRKLRA